MLKISLLIFNQVYSYLITNIRHHPVCRFIFHIQLLFLPLLITGVSNAQSTVWEKPFAGNDPTLLYYPDQQAVYFRYGWENKPGLNLVIKGKMPEARYFSFNLYNDNTKSSIAALADYEIKPDEGDNSSYTIYIMRAPDAAAYSNVIILPDSIKIASVFLRYYVARGNIYANKPLPIISMLENGVSKSPIPSIPISSMKPEDMAKLKSQIMANPKLISRKERKVLASKSASLQEKEPIISKVLTVPVFKHFTNPEAIGAYNFNPGGNYPNKDNHYILMPVVRSGKDVLVARFKAPGFATQLGDTSQQVRYFSLSQGNEYTNTSVTLYDEQLRVSPDGFIYVVVANDSKELRTKVEGMGINFMPWNYKDRLVLILRHMLPAPTFAQSTGEVPLFDKAKPAKGQEAEWSIGEYALVGRLMKLSAFKSISNTNQLGL
jgi:hypothetical protein